MSECISVHSCVPVLMFLVMFMHATSGETEMWLVCSVRQCAYVSVVFVRGGESKRKEFLLCS